MDMSELTGSCSTAVMTDDSYVTQVIKIVPFTGAIDVSCKNMNTDKDTGPCSSAMVTDDSYVTKVLKIAPAAGDTDGSHETEYDCTDWFVDIKPDNLQDIKEETKDVCYICKCNIIQTKTNYSSHRHMQAPLVLQNWRLLF